METNPRNIKISDYTYNLPQDRIAKFPLKQRDQSKLLIYKDGQISHTVFRDLPKLFDEETLLVVNNTKVIYARMLFQKPTGAKIEIFCLNPVEPSEYNLAFQSRGEAVWACMIGNRKKWKDGLLSKTFSAQGQEYSISAEYIAPYKENTHLVRFRWNRELTFSQVLDNIGLVPIPPYLNREAMPEDRQTYQTVYSREQGSVAAPTAGLHFTPQVLEELRNRGIEMAEVTLHVGAGTFRPVKTETIGEHPMHTEYFTVEAEQLQKIRHNLGRITAVGTTSMRTLESLYWLGLKMMNNPQDRFVAQWLPYEIAADKSVEEVFDFLIQYLADSGKERLEGWTQIIIVPGYEFKLVDNLITNFHQPQSTLLLLVAAFVGDDWRRIYEYALDNDFRFLSYGDSSLLFGRK